LTLADLQSLQTPAQVTAATATNIEATPDNGVDWGVVLADPTTAVTADGNGSSVDGAAASSGGLVANLHVSAFSGLTNVVIKIQSSPDNSVWTDFATFTTVTATTWQRKTVAGTVPRYLRATWDVTGTGSVTFTVAAARRG